jgi:hypothetical protein
MVANLNKKWPPKYQNPLIWAKFGFQVDLGFCPVVPEICRGQVHVPKKEKRKRRIRTRIAIAKQ